MEDEVHFIDTLALYMMSVFVKKNLWKRNPVFIETFNLRKCKRYEQSWKVYA